MSTQIGQNSGGPPAQLPRAVLNFEQKRRQGSARRKDSPPTKVVQYPTITRPFGTSLDVSLLDSVTMADCTIEATLQSGASKEGQAVCVIFGYQDPENYYFVHLGNMSAGHVNRIHCVIAGVPKPVPVKFAVNTTWQPNTEHRLRVERTVREGLIRIYFDDFATPVLEAVDTRLIQGQAGLGTFGTDLRLSDVKIKGVQARNFQRPTLA